MHFLKLRPHCVRCPMLCTCHMRRMLLCKRTVTGVSAFLFSLFLVLLYSGSGKSTLTSLLITSKAFSRAPIHHRCSAIENRIWASVLQGSFRCLECELVLLLARMQGLGSYIFHSMSPRGAVAAADRVLSSISSVGPRSF